MPKGGDGGVTTDAAREYALRRMRDAEMAKRAGRLGRKQFEAEGGLGFGALSASSPLDEFMGGAAE